jgi:hypothetical protein
VDVSLVAMSPSDCVHHGRSNQFSLLHHDKKIVLLPISPEAIVRDDIVRAAKS